MRINEEFAGKRISNILDIKTKYFIVSEGDKTEPAYFEGIAASSLCQNVSLINLLRNQRQSSISHPIRLIEFIKDYIKNVQTRTITVSDLIEAIHNWNVDTCFIDEVKIKEIDAYIKNEYGNDVLALDDIETILVDIFKSEALIDYIEELEKYIKSLYNTYTQNKDVISLVIDRDRQNFHEDQYKEIVEKCKNNKIDLYVSNPCFEFWLYLHFDEIEKEDKEVLFQNPKKTTSSKRRYIENKLCDVCGYHKNNLDFEKFEPFVKNAIEREKEYAEDIEELINTLGTNVGILVEKVIK